MTTPAIQQEYERRQKPVPEDRNPRTAFEGGVLDQIRDSEERLTRKIAESEARLTKQIEESEKRLRTEIRKVLNRVS